jgi:glycosyltransferase involved in cell wall biosynthesis
MDILVIGHSYIVDSNRQFWNQVAQNENVQVDIVVPKKWNSNLIKELEFQYNPKTDFSINNIYPLDCFFKGNASVYFFNWAQLFKIILNRKYDLIFVFQETWSLSVAQISLLKFFSKNKSSLYYLAVCQNIIKKKLSWVIPWEKFITKDVDKILYCTKEIIDVLEWKKIKTERIFFPFTYDQNIYDFKVKKNNEEIFIGYMGRLTEEKGINCLIDACKKLINEKYNLKLLLAGSGPLAEKNSESFIEYVGTFKHTEAHEFYHRINLFVLPSETRTFWKEQFGRVIVESVASGTPVVGSTSGAIPEVLAGLHLGYVFQEGSSDDLARVIKVLLSDMGKSDFIIKMNNANKLNLQKYSHVNVGKNLLALIKDDLR